MNLDIPSITPYTYSATPSNEAQFVIGTTQFPTTGTGQMLYNSNGQPMCQPVEEYAWSGLNFVLVCVGFLILAFAVYVIFEVYKESRCLEAENSATDSIKKPNARAKR
jgi:large-conductance mechanosensitive channel